MASGIHSACNRPKTSKNLKGNSGKKRFKVNSEAQSKYHAALAARRSKKLKKKR